MSKTLIVYLLDRTGSMSKILDNTLEGFNAYRKGLQEQGGDSVYFTLIQFDSISVDQVCVNTPIADVPQLTPENYKPRGWTPLLEASCKAIEAASTGASDPATKIIVCIQTDGEENASGPEYTWERLNKLIREKMEAGWQFNFLGANLDAYKQASLMGIPRASTMAFNASSREASLSAYGSTALRHASYATGQTATAGFDLADKLGAGDSFHQNYQDSAEKPASTDTVGSIVIPELPA